MPPAGLLVMTLQSRELGNEGPTQLHVSVAHDKSRPKAIRIEVGGTLPYTTERLVQLEEIARRGAVFGAVGKVWNWAST